MSIGRFLLFFVVFGGLTLGVHWYLYARLVRDPELAGATRTAVKWLIIVGGVAIMAGMSFMRGPKWLSTPTSWLAFIWMGVMFFLFVTVLAGDAVKLGLFVADKVRSVPPDPERRAFIARAIAASAGLFAFGMAGTGMKSALSRVAVKRVEVSLTKLPVAARGYRIVQLTDVHVGPMIGRGFIEEIVAQVNALNPDLVAITGDLVDGSVAELGDAVRPLGDIRAKDGVFFVTGNHEYYSGADEWIAFLSSVGIKTLRNERLPLPAGFDLAGVDDASAHAHEGHGEDMVKALGDRDKSRAVVLLAHQPRQVERAAEHQVDLQLSGHTHGGQMFPWGYLVRIQQKSFLRGLLRHEGTQVYVSCGTGYWGPPMRVGAPAEITEIVLA
jgi:hypothetical protein